MMKKRTVLALLAVVECGNLLAENNPVVLPVDTARVIDIEEVVVVATPKENNRLRRQPLSATSFSQEEMRKNNVVSIKSLSGLVPGLFIPDYGSKLTTSVYVRGIGSRINTPAVGLYVDNIPFVDKSAFDFNFSDIERVDVLCGPQSTLYGRNTMGGLIRVFTKSPFSYQGTDLRLSGATYNDYRASLTHYHRVSDTFAFSTGFFYEHEGGFFKNSLDGRRLDKSDEVGGKVRAIWLPSENLKVDFTLNYEYTKQGGYPYQLLSLKEKDVFYEDLKGDIGKISYGNDCGYKRNLLNGGVNLEYQANQFILSSVTGFQYLRDHMDLDQDFTRKNVYTMMQKQNSKTLSQELVMKSKPGKRWQWTTGVSGFYQWLETDGPVTFLEDGVKTMIEDNANKNFPDSPKAPKMKFTVNSKTMPVPGLFDTPVLNAAVYHQTTFNDLMVEGLSLTAGLRLDYEKVSMRYDTQSMLNFDFSMKMQMPGMPFPIVKEAKNKDAAIHFHGKETKDYMQLLPKVALQYNFDKHNNVYVSAAKGYRSGGFNIQMFSDVISSSLMGATMDVLAQDENFKKYAPIFQAFKKEPRNVREATLYRPEYSWNYEVGSHLTLFDGKLQADLAAFYMDTHDQQISKFAESGLGRVTVNAGKSRSMGAEAAFRSQITDCFALNGNYGFTYATFTDYAVSDTQNYDGNYVPFVPKHTFTAGAQYRIPVKAAWMDYITLDVNYKGAGRIYWTEQNDASQKLYGTLNGRVSFSKGKGQVALWVNNVLDTDYQTFYFETMNRGFAQMGRPMQLGVDIRCCF